MIIAAHDIWVLDMLVARPARYLLEGPATYGPGRPTREDVEELEAGALVRSYDLARWAERTLLGEPVDEWETRRVREAAIAEKTLTDARRVLVDGWRREEMLPVVSG